MPLDTRPVVVIGNGPVGQTTALLLARWGIRVVVVDERSSRDVVGSKAICQQRDVLDIWESVGAGHRIAGEGLTWTRARTFYRDEELSCVGFEDRGSSPFPPFVNISQSRTEEVLDELVAAQPLVTVRWDHRVTALRQDAGGVTVTCETGTVTLDLEAAYVVACSGAGGDVRRMLGLSFDGQTFGDQFLICDVRTDLPAWQSERRFYFDPVWNPGRQVLIHPCPASVFRIDWQVPDSFDLAAEESSGGLHRRITQVVGDRGYEVVWRSAYRFHSRVVDRMRTGRVLVAGDAAHLFSPFGARGLNSGVQDAENAAWKIAFVMHGWADHRLLESYHDERHAAALENLDVTAATMRFLVPQDDGERRRRLDVLERARHHGPVARDVDSGRLAEPFWYTDSPLTTPDRTRPSPGRPPKGRTPAPAPGVLVPDLPVTFHGHPTRLRDVARRGLTILTTGGLPRTVVSQRAPVQVAEIDDLSPDLRDVLGARPDETWVLRPDGHIAAVTTGSAGLSPALARALGR